LTSVRRNVYVWLASTGSGKPKRNVLQKLLHVAAKQNKKIKTKKDLMQH
jgi:hypothetical protein